MSGVAAEAVGGIIADGAGSGQDAPTLARAKVGAGGTAAGEGTKP